MQVTVSQVEHELLLTVRGAGLNAPRIEALGKVARGISEVRYGEIKVKIRTGASCGWTSSRGRGLDRFMSTRLVCCVSPGLSREIRWTLDPEEIRKPWYRGGWCFAVRAVAAIFVLFVLRFVTGWLGISYILGYFFATAIAHVPIARLVKQSWLLVPRRFYPPAVHKLEWATFGLGLIERALYVTVLLIGGPALAFIGVWLALKVAGQWDYWKSPKTGKLYNLFLIGNGLSLVYAVTGWFLIRWTSDRICLNRFFASSVLGCSPGECLQSVCPVWQDVLTGLTAVAIAATLLVITICSYGSLRGLSEVKSTLTVVFIDGTEKEFDVTDDMIRQLEDQQGGPAQLYVLGDEKNKGKPPRLTLKASEIRAWYAGKEDD